MAKTKSITETGPKALKGMRNPDLYPTQSLGLSDIELKSINDELARSAHADYNASHGHLGYQGLGDQSLYSPQVMQGFDYGSSSYDDGVLVDANPQDVQNQRADSQPWYQQIGNGLAKGVLLAGTTFLDGTIGLLLGAGTAINEGRWSGLWDNDFSKAMQAVNEWSEQAMPNYYSEEEQNSPWYENIFTANFLGDKFIKNLGFTVGAFYSGGLEAGLMKGLGKAAIKGMSKIGATSQAIKNATKASNMVASTMGALTSAVNEGRIEALNNSKDWYESTLAPIKDDYTAKRKALLEAGDYESLAELDKGYEETMAQLNEDRLHMGNMDLIMNIPILTASNLIQFGKLYANGFRTGRRANNIVGNITEGYRGGTTKATGIRKAILNPLSEGTEEITQGMASRISGDYYGTDVNNFYKAKTDPDAQQETLDFWKSFAQGINETVNDGSAWEEFFIGTLTGALGMPRFRGMKNDQGKFQSPVTLEGGIIGELRENSERMDREQQIADYMNDRLNSPEFKNYYQGLTRHNFYQAAMDKALEDGDNFDFKNAEEAQFISDISMFDAAGKIGDLTDLINSSYDTSDENLESIVRNTTSVRTADEIADEIRDNISYYEDQVQMALDDGDQKAVDWYTNRINRLNEDLNNVSDTYIGPFIDSDGNSMLSTESGKQEMIDKLTKTKDDMLGQIDDYVKAKIDLQGRLPESISNDQLEELVFLQTQVNNWDKRGESMTPHIKSILGEASETLRTLASSASLSGNEEDADTHTENAEYIEKLVNEKSPKQLMQILSGPGNTVIASKLSDIIYSYGNNVIDNLSKNDVVEMLDDLVRIGQAKTLYQERLQKYIENPGEQLAAQAQSREQQDNARTVTDNITQVDRIHNADVSDIVADLENGDMDFDALDDILSNMEDEDARDKVETARDIIDMDAMSRDDLDGLFQSGEITEEQLDDALRLLDNSKSMSQSTDEFLDLDTEAFNDPHALDDVDARQTVQQAAEAQGMSMEDASQQYNEIMNQRLDAAKNALQVVRELRQQRESQLENIPGGSPQVDTSDDNPPVQTGHDSVDRNTPVNAPTVTEPTLADQNRELTDKTLNKYGHSREENPQLAKDFDNIFSYVDRGLASNTSDQDIANAISKTGTYQRLDQLGYPMSALLQRAIEVKKQGMEVTPVAQQGVTPIIESTPDTSATYESDIESENNRDLSNQSTEASVETSRMEGTTATVGRVDGTYNYWRPSTTELPIHRKRGDNRPYWQTTNSPSKARYQATYEYLKDNGAFTRVNNNSVKKGDEIHFGISKSLTDKVGQPIILLLNSNNEVIGDLPMPEDAGFNSYAGLADLYNGAKDWYQSNKDNLHSEGNDIAVIPGYKTNVARNMVGKPQYTSQDERHTLNEINTVTNSGGSQVRVPFKLGIGVSHADSGMVRIMADAGRSASQGASKLERTIMSPLKVAKGQPFLLMPTSSKTRAFVPVPIMMPKFDANNPKVANSTLGKLVIQKIQELATVPNNQDKLQTWTDELRELLAFKEFYAGYDNLSIGQNGQRQQNFVVKFKNAEDNKWVELFSGNKEDAPAGILSNISRLGGAMFQVSRKYINDTYAGQDYNSMIGELAETNLPIGATHTVNDWYTLDPIVDRKQQKAHSPKSTKTNPSSTQGSVIRFRDTTGNSYYMTNSYRLYRENPNGSDVELLGEQYNALKAHALGLKLGKDMTQPYDTRYGYYNPKTGKFQSKEADQKPIAIGTIEGPALDQITASSSKIAFNSSDHSYTINGKPADMSVTQWVHRDNVIEPEADGILGYLEVSSRLGSEVDTMARNFFEGKIYESPLLTKEQNAALRGEIYKLKENLDSLFGKGNYRAITDENLLRVAGAINTPEGLKTIAGTMDMLIQDSRGNFHIIDFKTKRAKVAGQHGIIGDTKAGYDSQVSLYAALLQQSNPAFKGKITGSYLAIFNTFYDTPKGARSNEVGNTTYTEENGWIYAQVGDSDRVFIHELPTFRPGTFNRLQLVDWDRTLPSIVSADFTTTDTVGASPVALEYLLENGKGTIESLGYFLHGVSAAYPAISDKLESIRNKYKGILGENPNTVSSHKDLVKELQDAVEKTYGKDGVDILNELIKNSTGFVPREGKEMSTRIENLKPVETAPQTRNQPQITREEALKDLKSKGLLNKKERNAALDKLSDDRLIKVATLSKLKARQTLEKFDAKVKANMSPDEINAVLDSVMGSRPLNREVINEMAESKNWSREDEIEKMSKVLPQLNEDGRVRVVNGLIRIARTGDPAYAWGQFQNGVITLSNKAARGTMYHEAFHFVTQTLLSPKELDTLYKDAEQRYGKAKRLELEESLAEDFRQFMQSYDDGGVFKNIFRTLKHIIKSIFGKDTVTNKLFHDIRRGALASRTISSSDGVLYRRDAMALQNELDKLRNLYKVSHSRNFKSEMQRFNGSVNRNFGQAEYIIEKYGLQDVAYVFEGQYGAAKIGVVSLKEFTKRADRLKAQIQNAWESELSDDERLSNWALEQQETYYREVEQYHREKLDYGRLDKEQKDYIAERGLSIEEYNSMTPQEKEVLFRCMH